jgi:hypothetical protein
VTGEDVHVGTPSLRQAGQALGFFAPGGRQARTSLDLRCGRIRRTVEVPIAPGAVTRTVIVVVPVRSRPLKRSRPKLRAPFLSDLLVNL